MATLDGDPWEQIVIDGEKWLFWAPPVSIYYRFKDMVSGREEWEALCVATLYPDYRYVVKNSARRKMFLYQRKKQPVSIGDQSKITCQSMRIAKTVEIKPTKPKFIGNLKELEKLTPGTEKKGT